MNLKIIGVAIVALLLTACVREELISIDDPSPEGKVRLELRLNLAGAEEVAQTRSTAGEEKVLDPDKVYVLVADKTDADGVLRQKPVKASVVETDKIYAVLSEETEPSYVYVLANVTSANATYLNSLEGTEALSAIKTALMLNAPPASGITHPFPMEGVSDQLATLKKGSTLPTSIPLVRAVARIDVNAGAVSVDDFEMVSVRLVNAARSGWLFQPDPIPAQLNGDVMPYDAASTVVANSVTNQIYCYENNGESGVFTKNPTRIVVEGRYKGGATTSFYGIDIAYKIGAASTDPLLYDITRNFIYTVNISKVDKDGYASYNEAAKSASYNSGIEADITVTDPYAHNIVTNGKQYMGTTNTSLTVYPLADNKDVTYVTAAIISYTTDPGWERGEIIATGGITFVSNASTRDVLSVGSGSTPVIREIQINIPAAFTEGTIKAHIGNISQTITVIKKTPMSPAGDVLIDFAQGNDYVVGEIVSPSASTSWLKVSSEETGLNASSLLDKVTNPEGKMYIHIASNVDFNGTATARAAQLFVASRNDEQRTRVHVEQNKIDVYTENTAIEPYTYVGTFHRWNQTAERIIRIEATQSKTPLTGVWSATVVSGDFIVLSTSFPKDSGINPYNPYGEDGAHYTTDEQIEANCQVTDGKRSVHGTIGGSTPHIYFKVGLTSRLNAVTAQPRYGLIALTYNGTATQFIYVRQGEESDYLMRPNDPIVYLPINDIAGTDYVNPNVRYPMNTRTYARKLGVYNLRTTSAATGLSDRGKYGHTFVRYPSQGGDYYFQTGTYAITQGVSGEVSLGNNAEAILKVPNAVVPTYFQTNRWETCPTGYRRISDGINTGNDGWIASDYGRVADSENRQSYWLFPMKKYENSNFSNQIKGYLADGYFDRRKIVDVNSHKAAVSYPGRDASFWGYLVFNPYNYASIFLPISGNFNSKGAKQFTTLEKVAEVCGFLTSTFEGGYNVWVTNYGVVIRDEVFDNYTTTGGVDAYPIRCIRDENAPVLNPDDGVTVNPFPEGPGQELISARINYTTGASSLETQLAAAYPNSGDIEKINSLVISGNKELTADDFSYLNTWADRSADLSSGNKLQHLLIRGLGTPKIPAEAFTSVNWKSITLHDAKEIADGAFNLSNGNTLYSLVLGNFDAITMTAAAFGANVTTRTIHLTLSGAEYTNVNQTPVPPTWRGLEWKSIKEQK